MATWSKSSKNDETIDAKKSGESTSLAAGGVGRPGQLPDLGVPQGPRHNSSLKVCLGQEEFLGSKV